MTRYPLFRFLVLGLSLLVASTCATPPIAKQYRQEAQAEDLTFSMVLQDPDAYVGDIVLWGGSIIETKNLKEVTGKRAMSLGETTYTYPVVAVKQLHLWERRPRYVYHVYPYGDWGWGPYWGWDSDYYGDFDEDFDRGGEGMERGGERGGDRD
jgi:starvation-inducible outer membrane lipoprotein